MSTEPEKFLEWCTFFKSLAFKLLNFKDNRSLLVSKIKNCFKENNIRLPSLDSSDESFTDIDPFTVFGLFNKGQKLDTRVQIASILAKEFGIRECVPKEFIGVPILHNLQATFYAFCNERGPMDIDELWDLFTSAIDLTKEHSESCKEKFVTSFDKVMQKKGIANSKLTIALFWISPETYLSLDNNNISFFNSNLLPEEFRKTIPAIKQWIKGSDYLSIVDLFKNAISSNRIPFSSFQEISYKAYQYSKEHDSLADSGIIKRKYWVYAPGENACKWNEFYEQGIMGIDWDYLGDLSSFESKEKIKEFMRKHDNAPDQTYMNDGLATWQFCKEIQVGDVIYAKKGKDKLIGRGIVESEYIYDDTRNSYKHIRKVKWTHKKEYEASEKFAIKTLTEITPYTDLVQNSESCFLGAFDSPSSINLNQLDDYDMRSFIQDVFMEEKDYKDIVGLLEHKKNIILQGAPGVGKTYVAKRLAYSIIKKKDPDKVMMVQFHQSYSYEDFIRGYRPKENGFELVDGPFYKFCKKAEIDSDHKYFFIIDEINRGNISKIFGELFMLIEADKRRYPNQLSSPSIQLLYKKKELDSAEQFSIPSNLYIIGMMNTADRSLAVLDFALRRRFGFYDMNPAFENNRFKEYVKSLNSGKFEKVIDAIKALNSTICDDPSLGKGFSIGHSFFCNLTSETVDQKLDSIVKFEIIPLIQEYWFDEQNQVIDQINKLMTALE